MRYAGKPKRHTSSDLDRRLLALATEQRKLVLLRKPNADRPAAPPNYFAAPLSRSGRYDCERKFAWKLSGGINDNFCACLGEVSQATFLLGEAIGCGDPGGLMPSPADLAFKLQLRF